MWKVPCSLVLRFWPCVWPVRTVKKLQNKILFHRFFHGFYFTGFKTGFFTGFDPVKSALFTGFQNFTSCEKPVKNFWKNTWKLVFHSFFHGKIHRFSSNSEMQVCKHSDHIIWILTAYSICQMCLLIGWTLGDLGEFSTVCQVWMTVLYSNLAWV